MLNESTEKRLDVTLNAITKMKHDIGNIVRLSSKTTKDPAGREAQILEDTSAARIASECNCRVGDVYIESMKSGIYPLRYLRNRDTISLSEQLTLAKSKVSIVGAGGLGGQVILLLARLGIGHLLVVDKDIFDETNLNRQALCNKNTLGKPKADVAAETVALVNKGVTIVSFPVSLKSSNAFEILNGSDVVVDALDNIPDRFMLEETCNKLGIPLVHGALAGFEGQIMTIFPDDSGFNSLYKDRRADHDKAKSPESVLGVPALMPSLIATFQVMEALKIILKRGRVFRNSMLHVDIESGQINEFTFKNRT